MISDQVVIVLYCQPEGGGVPILAIDRGVQCV